MIGDGAGLTDLLSTFIRTYKQTRVPLSAIRQHAMENDHGFVADPSARDRLHRSLTELQERLEVSWPKSLSGLDTRADPVLPRWVARVAATGNSQPAAAPARVWPSVLEPAARTATRPDERELLETIAGWLAANPTPEVVPVQERSLEITGDEKRFDRLRGTRLFTSGSLTLDMLACAAPPLPFASTHVAGNGRTQLLAAENSATYQSLTRTLQALPSTERPDTHVVWGAGRQFPIAAEHVPMLEPAPQKWLYFGDLDLAGLQIAHNAARTISRVTGGKLIPASSLYEAALRFGNPRPDPSNKATIPDLAPVLAWLPEQLRGSVEQLLHARERIPQETVGLRLLRVHPEALRSLL